MLRVMGRDGQADLCVGLEAAVGREHREGGRLERVLSRKQNAPVIYASLSRELGVGSQHNEAKGN